MRSTVPGKRIRAGSREPPRRFFPQDAAERVGQGVADLLVARRLHGALNLTMHPTNGGHRSVMPHLEKLMAHIKSKPDVWIATGAEVAAYLKKTLMGETTH